MKSNALTRLTHAVMIVAALAAIVIAMPVHAQPTPPMVVMPRVEVVGQRVAPAPVVQLPRVVITGRRLDSNDTRQAQREARPPVQPATQLLAMR
ncbi:MAG TPA: hypothetical protein VJ743_17490 [Albitalea sp.]|nr:hypothetical protein [Albitalea sp.]